MVSRVHQAMTSGCSGRGKKEHVMHAKSYGREAKEDLRVLLYDIFPAKMTVEVIQLHQVVPAGLEGFRGQCVGVQGIT